MYSPGMDEMKTQLNSWTPPSLQMYQEMNKKEKKKSFLHSTFFVMHNIAHAIVGRNLALPFIFIFLAFQMSQCIHSFHLGIFCVKMSVGNLGLFYNIWTASNHAIYETNLDKEQD